MARAIARAILGPKKSGEGGGGSGRWLIVR
jgi:hypothetical protein